MFKSDLQLTSFGSDVVDPSSELRAVCVSCSYMTSNKTFRYDVIPPSLILSRFFKVFKVFLGTIH